MNELEKLFNTKKTENGDTAYKSTGSKLIDLLFMTEYYQKHLNEVKIGNSDKDKLFAMFIRDAREGLGKRDLGRELMKQAEVEPQNIVFAGRFDDLYHNPTDNNIKFLRDAVYSKNALAQKWCPRLMGKDRKIAKALCKEWGITEKKYRQLIKVCTTESMLTEKKIDDIEFDKVPSLAMVKYYNRFMKEPRFREYIEQVKKGDKKLNISTTTVYDIYKNRERIDAQLFFDKIEKIKINCIPVLDTSGSMQDRNDSIGKATAIAHYLAKCSTFAPDYVVSFSSRPQLIHMGYDRKGESRTTYWGNSSIYGAFKYDNTQSKYINEIKSLYTGDCSNTDFAKVMDLLKGLEKTPDYLVVLSDMEFDEGSSMSKTKTMNYFKQKGYKTRIVWWNFNARNTTAPEMDSDGNVFISGYSPFLLKYLEAGFDGNAFLDKLLNEYAKKVSTSDTNSQESVKKVRKTVKNS
jgi:hypothetical protein